MRVTGAVASSKRVAPVRCAYCRGDLDLQSIIILACARADDCYRIVLDLGLQTDEREYSMSDSVHDGGGPHCPGDWQATLLAQRPAHPHQMGLGAPVRLDINRESDQLAPF